MTLLIRASDVLTVRKSNFLVVAQLRWKVAYRRDNSARLVQKCLNWPVRQKKICLVQVQVTVISNVRQFAIRRSGYRRRGKYGRIPGH
jgi:hypothetical protein